jgi:hypothetical protein
VLVPAGARPTVTLEGLVLKRRWLSVPLALVFVVMATGSTAALTVQRTWYAGVGTSSVNGTASLVAYQGGTGRLNLSLKSLRARTEYKIEIRGGTCTSLGAVVARPFAATTDSTGRISTYRNLSGTTMNAVWTVARGSFVVRFVHTSGSKCGNFYFYKATRIRISTLGIDLPVIAGSTTYPKCNVAMYLRTLWQPREPGVTFLYAHARTGMFLPLLNHSKINDGAGLIGRVVAVYTNDSKIHYYRIDRVRRHVTSMSSAISVTTERLWLQTSEGPNWTYPKVIVEARRTSTGPTTYAASHPTARPISC